MAAVPAGMAMRPAGRPLLPAGTWQFPLEKPRFQRENVAINSKSAACYFDGACVVGAGGVGVGELVSLWLRTLLRMPWSFLAAGVLLPPAFMKHF